MKKKETRPGKMYLKINSAYYAWRWFILFYLFIYLLFLFVLYERKRIIGSIPEEILRSFMPLPFVKKIS